MRLNLGCGHIQPPGWTNVDGSNRAWLASTLPWLDTFLVAARILPPTDFSRGTTWTNLLRPFPWDNGSVDAIYMGEMLEHFTRKDGEFVLRECFRVLKSGGILRIRVPDNAAFWSKYIAAYQRTKELSREEWSLDHTRWTSMFFNDLCTTRPGLWQSMGHFHKWMYDDISLTLLLESLGFKSVERKGFHDSEIHDITAVEERDDLILEAKKA